MSNTNGNGNGKKPSRREQSLETNATARAFLAAVAKTGNITRAAAIAGCSRQRHYQWLYRIEEYEKAFADAMDQAADLLEAEARRRAVEGVIEPVFYQGATVGAIRSYSDTLLIFLLKGARPEKFRDRHHVEHSGKIDGGSSDALSLLADPEVASAFDRAHARRTARGPMADPGSSRN
jgi:hypothetical protein